MGEHLKFIFVTDLHGNIGKYETVLKYALEHADDKTIMACHQPPYSMGLDVCLNGSRVGSKSVFDWIQKEQPLIFLSGHIHESYLMTGVWKFKLGKTLVIQPGQHRKETIFVLVEINKEKVTSNLICM